MEITTDNLKIVYDRLIQYCLVRRVTLPDRIEIQEDGKFCCEFDAGYRDYPEEQIVPVEHLNESLDVLINERKEIEKRDKARSEKKLKEFYAYKAEAEKFERKQQYEKLKKEFE